MGVAPAQPKPFGQFHFDPPIRACLARWRDCWSAQLHLPVGIGDRAALFRKGGGGQDDIGIIGRFGDKNILHHQMLQLGQSIPRMGHIRIRHGGVLAQHIHAANIAPVHSIHDFGNGETFVGVQRFIYAAIAGPDRRKFGTDIIADHGLHIGQEHRDETCVRRTLYIVLPAQGMQPRTRPAHMPGHERQADQAA